jgi:hypothetical protein
MRGFVRKFIRASLRSSIARVVSWKPSMVAS